MSETTFSATGDSALAMNASLHLRQSIEEMERYIDQETRALGMNGKPSRLSDALWEKQHAYIADIHAAMTKLREAETFFIKRWPREHVLEHAGL